MRVRPGAAAACSVSAETMTVPDDYKLTAPEGSTVLIDEHKQTEWASWHILKYRFGGAAFGRAPRARRRRARRE